MLGIEETEVFKRVLAPVIERVGATGTLRSTRLQGDWCYNRGIKGMVAWQGE